MLDAFGGSLIAALILGSLIYLYKNHSPFEFGPELSCLPPLDVRHSFYDKGNPITGNLRVKHRVVLVRHGQSNHNKRHDKPQGDALPAIPDLDTPLSCEGQEQARQVGNYLSKFAWKPDSIIVSPMQRAIQTAVPYVNKVFGVTPSSTVYEFSHSNDSKHKTRIAFSERWMEVNTWGDQNLATAETKDIVTKKETFAGFQDRVNGLKHCLEAVGDQCEADERTQTLVFTHSMVISELLNSIVSERRDEVDPDKWPRVYWQVNNGSITCLDYLENGEWNIHAMNYCGHLSVHTGAKAPFV